MLVAWSPDTTVTRYNSTGSNPYTVIVPSNVISYQIFAADGSAGSATQLTVGGANDEVRNVGITATPDGGFILSWEVTSATYPSASETAYLQRYDANGQSVGAAVQITSFAGNLLDPSAGLEPSVAVEDDGRMLVAWSPDTTVTGITPLAVTPTPLLSLLM